ncbi:hypothetical protein [Cellulosimicrobium arenosum]|uniref:Uncharacterized protein n=1 Tax=Cellulosimicrobium arenosum TaxID=2708133 RepID=A0A927IYP5_9MICO|nr:hypothetical protein [Cellulosimicrobium arenosum]MBD8077603.1 hypothetical protein [Cellulosimicrobium arenosum]
MNGYSIDPDAVAWHADSFWSYSGLVVRTSWADVGECLAPEVESSITQLREWFEASWSSTDWELVELADSTARSARVLGAADDDASSAAADAAASLGACPVALTVSPATAGSSRALGSRTT